MKQAVRFIVTLLMVVVEHPMIISPSFSESVPSVFVVSFTAVLRGVTELFLVPGQRYSPPTTLFLGFPHCPLGTRTNFVSCNHIHLNEYVYRFELSVLP